ncbi:MAG: hypothetical protein LBL24_07825 [Bacteroidales bacterium]|nr:hypothetical protein [Bacteroidales bacterium]
MNALTGKIRTEGFTLAVGCRKASNVDNPLRSATRGTMEDSAIPQTRSGLNCFAVRTGRSPVSTPSYACGLHGVIQIVTPSGVTRRLVEESGVFPVRETISIEKMCTAAGPIFFNVYSIDFYYICDST